MRKNINNYLLDHLQNNKESMNYKLNKYEYKLLNMQNIYFHFNTYGKPIPEKYINLVNLIKSDFSYIKEATRTEHVLIGKQADELCKDNYSANFNFTVGSFQIIFTLFVLNQNKIESAMNIILKDNNKCYIESFSGYSNNILIDTLKEICKKYNIVNIEKFSIYQPETDYLLNNGFILNKNRILQYEL